MANLASILTHLRAVVALAAAGVIAASLYAFQAQGAPTRGWWLLAGGFLLALLGQLGIDYPALEPAPPPRAPSRLRRWLGILLALGGVALWALSVRTIMRSWVEGFDAAWAGWFGATVLLAVGADLAWGVWPRPAGRRWPAALIAAIAVLLAIAGWLRLGNIADFPGEAAITQIEDLQVGAFGHSYLTGYRLRWEYLSSAWLSAIGIALGGISQAAVRVPFAVVSAIKLVPIFIWLRLLVGTGGALAGCALLAISFWDVVLSRIPNNHNVLIVAIAFALLAGPARRGRPSAYVVLGFLGGYILHEYIAYRPLVLWAVLGAAWWSLADRGASWLARLGRPLVTVALIATMITPLFVTRLTGEHWREYVDGWARAHSQTSYYNPQDTWVEALERRRARAERTAELFLWRGDSSPVRNRHLWPLVDPVTTALLVLGIAGALVHPLRPVLALTLAGGFVHVCGTLVMTGNFDVARVGGAAGYVYVLAGAGAAGVAAALGAAWGRIGRTLAWALVAVAIAWASWWNISHLQAFWGSTDVRRAHRNNLAYVTIWLREHYLPGERVLGIAPHHPFVIRGHDGIWLLGWERPPGEVFGDVQTALHAWPPDAGPTLVVLFVERNTEDIAAYLHWLAPGLTFTIDRDPLDAGGDIAWARSPGRPPELEARLAAAACRGATAEFMLLGANPDEVLAEERVIVPFLDRSVWPDALMQQVYRVGASRLRLRVTAPFTVETGGAYAFALEGYGGQMSFRVDDRRRHGPGVLHLQLEPGAHELVVEGEFSLTTPSVSMRWSGPDTGDRQELMPFYRVAVPPTGCPVPDGEVADAP